MRTIRTYLEGRQRGGTGMQVSGRRGAKQKARAWAKEGSPEMRGVVWCGCTVMRHACANAPPPPPPPPTASPPLGLTGRLWRYPPAPRRRRASQAAARSGGEERRQGRAARQDVCGKSPDPAKLQPTMACPPLLPSIMAASYNLPPVLSLPDAPTPQPAHEPSSPHLHDPHRWCSHQDLPEAVRPVALRLLLCTAALPLPFRFAALPAHPTCVTHTAVEIMSCQNEPCRM